MISSRRTTKERGAWRMGVGAVLAFVGMIGLAGGSLVGAVLLLTAVVLFIWGNQRGTNGPSLPRLADLLKRTAFRLAGVLERLAWGLRK